MLANLLKHGHRFVLPPFIAAEIADQLQFGRRLGDSGAGFQQAGEFTQLLIGIKEAMQEVMCYVVGSIDGRI